MYVCMYLSLSLSLSLSLYIYIYIYIYITNYDAHFSVILVQFLKYTQHYECSHHYIDVKSCALSYICATLLNMCTLSLITIPHALLMCVQDQNLLQSTHQGICTITFMIVTHESLTYMYNYKGSILWTLHSPPHYLCIFLSVSYRHVHTKFQKPSKRWGYSTCRASSFS